MREFFKSWKRKVGVAALAMACVLTGGWVRSLRVCDVINTPLGGGSVLTVSSAYGSLVFRLGSIEENPWNELDWLERDVTSLDHLNSSEWTSSSGLTQTPFPLGEGDIVTWDFNSCGLGLGRSSSDEPYNRRCRYSLIPYWFAVLPITVCSLWLLIGKP